jgi:hypothetical protein
MPIILNALEAATFIPDPVFNINIYYLGRYRYRRIFENFKRTFIRMYKLYNELFKRYEL